jgi:hypothetical protein
MPRQADAIRHDATHVQTHDASTHMVELRGFPQRIQSSVDGFGVALAATKLDLCRQRVQQQTCGHRGRTGDPLNRVRRTLRTRYPVIPGTAVRVNLPLCQ